MAFPVNHKTVFVLDESPNFSMAADQMDFDFHKSRNVGGNYTAAPPIVKTMWTCATESVLEYCRIVWDIFPKDKLIQFVVSSLEAVSVNNWDKNEQNCTHVSRGFARCGWPEQLEFKKKSSSSNQKK